MYIDKMSLADCPRVAEIEKLCFSVPWSLESFEGEFKLDYAFYFAAYEEGNVVGYVGVHNTMWEGEITMIAVHPDFRRRGIARKLMERIIAFEKEKGIEQINLEVRESNISAVSLYEKLGYTKDGIRKNYYKDPVENAILMSYAI